MIDFDNVPLNVRKLATGCFLQHIGPAELLDLSPPDAAAIAENFGIRLEDYIAAIRWFAEYHDKHIEALQEYVRQRRDSIQ